MEKNEYLSLKKATFYLDKIVIHKRKGDITISLKEVERFCYNEPTFWNYITSWSGGLFPGRFGIKLKKPHHGKKAIYLIKMSSYEFQKLPFEYSAWMYGEIF